MNGICAVIPAAGLSSRMGDFKPLLPFGESTVIEQLICKLKYAGIPCICVVTGKNADLLQDKLSQYDLSFVHNCDYASTQMLDSLKKGIEWALSEKWERILVLPVDLPGIKVSTIEKCMEAKGRIVRPVCFGHHGHPIILSKEAASYVLQYEGENGLRGAINAFDANIVDVCVDDCTIRFDMDTPSEYEQLKELYFEERGEADEIY